MGYGATPHRIKDARGADEPRLFLEKKEGKKNSRKRCFRQGDYRFLRKYASAWRENMRFSGNTFPLGKENKRFFGSALLDRR